MRDYSLAKGLDWGYFLERQRRLSSTIREVRQLPQLAAFSRVWSWMITSPPRVGGKCGAGPLDVR